MSSYSATKQEILQAYVPEETRSYKPISHEKLIDLTLEGIGKAGFQLDKELYSYSRNGNQATGRYTISNVADNEMQLQIGWQNSYDKSLSLKFAIGTFIMICSNGCVRGNYGSFKKKHVGTIQTFAPETIAEYIQNSGEVFRQIQKERDALKQIELSNTRRAELLGRLYFEQGIVKPDQVAIIRNEIEKPTHDYNCKDSAWELYNYCNFALKNSHPANYFQQHAELHNFFINDAGLIVNPQGEELFTAGLELA
jgi:hypothetical protein